MRGGLREVTFFWQIERLHLRSEMIPLLNLCESMTILGVIEQSPESLVLTTRINTKEGKTIDDLQRLGFFSSGCRRRALARRFQHLRSEGQVLD